MNPETERDIGRLEGKVDSVEKTLATMQGQLAELNAYMAETKGGWKTLLALAGMASALGSAATWIAAHLWKA